MRSIASNHPGVGDNVTVNIYSGYSLTIEQAVPPVVQRFGRFCVVGTLPKERSSIGCKGAIRFSS